MSYLTIDLEHITAAWDSAGLETLHTQPEPLLTPAEQQDYGRRAVAIHVPRTWPHGTFCNKCGFVFPCTVALRGMGLLRRRGWELPDVIDLIEAIQGGERQ